MQSETPLRARAFRQACVPVSLALLFVFLIPRVAPAAAPALSPDDLSRLQRGEIIVKEELPSVEGDSIGNGGTAVAVLKADLETIWLVLTGFTHYAGLFPRLTGFRGRRSGRAACSRSFPVKHRPVPFPVFGRPWDLLARPAEPLATGPDRGQQSVP